MSKCKQPKTQPSLFDSVISGDPKHVGIPGVAVDVMPEEADAMGEFVADALSEQDAIESMDVPAEYDQMDPPGGWASDGERLPANLREAHRVLSEQVMNAGDLTGRIEQVRQSQIFSDDQQPTPAKPHSLLPARHANRDFFLADLFDYAMKDDGVSMEAPIFTLSTKPDLSTWNWQSQDGSRSIEVYPSVKGRATQFDKDVLIFVVSQMTEALNRKRDDAKNRTVRFVVYDYLLSTNKPTGGIEYQRLELSLDRLRGTSIKTDIRTGGERVREGFGIIDKWKVVEKSPDNERMIAVEVTLSEWLFNAVQAHEVLTIHRDYFRLRKPLERRLYELARKHCGQQPNWKIGLDLLREKCGSKTHLRDFRSQIVAIANAKTLPEYLMHYSSESNQVTFLRKKILASLA